MGLAETSEPETMDRHLAMRPVLRAGITAVASALVALWLALTGQSESAHRPWWPLPVDLFIFVYICVDFA